MVLFHSRHDIFPFDLGLFVLVSVWVGALLCEGYGAVGISG
jgi:hypothetical protein